MKIVDSAQQRNPEQIAKQLNSLVDQLKANVETAAHEGESFDFVERSVLTSVLEIGRRALDFLLALRGDGDLGNAVQTHDGKTAQRGKTKSTTKLRSIFGEHVFEQFTYMAGKKQSISLRPISARLSLPPSR